MKIENRKKLGDVIKEYKEKNTDNKYKPVAVGRYGIRKREDIYSKELAKDYSKNKLIYKNTLTVGMGSKQIDIGILTEDEIYAVSPAYHTFRINNIDANYLRYCLDARNADMSERFMIASARQGKSVDFKKMLEYEIPVYSESDTQTILYNLSKIENIILNLDSQLEKMELLVKSRFIEMFGDPVSNPKSWDKYPIKDCLIRIENGKSFVCSNQEREGDSPAILKLSAATYGEYLPEENKALLDDDLFNSEVEVREGDLLFTRKNTPDLVGMAAYVYKTPPKLMMPDLIFRLVPNERINPIFLWQLINCREFRPIIRRAASGSAQSMSNISKERLGKIQIICPPISEQERLLPLMKQIDKSKLAVQEMKNKMEILKASVMQEYFC
jgi:type I restriction enzyme S subunit